MQRAFETLVASIPSDGRWGCIAARLLEIKRGPELCGLNRSFSFFIKELASSQGKTESTYWRLVKAGEVYTENRKFLDPNGTDIPELTSPKVEATPESLEIAEKIRRAAPAEIATKTAYKAMKGMISRSELRDLWETYRPTLKGENARGKTAPKFNEHDPEMRKAQDRANRIAPVVLSEPDWLQLAQFPYSYRVMNLPIRGPFRSLLSAVAVLAETPESPMILHGLYAGNGPLPLRSDKSPDLNGSLLDFPFFAVDHIWFVCTTTAEPKEIVIPDEMGVVICSGDRVEIKRGAKTLKPNAAARAQLLSELLRESLRIRRTRPVSE